MAEKIPAGKRRSRSDAITYLCTQQCQCLPYYSSLLLKEIKPTQTPTTNSRFHKSTRQGNSTTLPTNNNNHLTSQEEEIKASSEAAAKAAITHGSSHGLKGLQVQGLKPISFVPRNQEITPPDEYSQTVVGAVKAKGKTDDNIYYDEHETLSESSSLYSLHASNSTSDKHEEAGDVLVKDKLARKGTGIKRKRGNAEFHNFLERKRRDKINKKMRMLKDLIPNCNKMDKASMLDDAIKYLKALKRQLQIMSMAQIRMPLMMLPTATPHMMMMHTPHLHHSMEFRTPLPVINDNNGVRMFDFPNQMPLR